LVGYMVGEVVVVFYRLEGRGLAEETEMVDWVGGWEEGLYRYEKVIEI
jgi:hypothetical protein